MIFPIFQWFKLDVSSHSCDSQGAHNEEGEYSGEEEEGSEYVSEEDDSTEEAKEGESDDDKRRNWRRDGRRERPVIKERDLVLEDLRKVQMKRSNLEMIIGEPYFDKFVNGLYARVYIG